jgi:hypothetical protein
MNLVGRSLRRFWQPRRGLFWLALVVNGLSSVLVLLIQTGQVAGPMRLLLGLLALSDTLLGWWLLRRLWIEAGPEGGSTPG